MLQAKSLSDTGDIIQAPFEAIHLGCGNAYTEHPIIKKYLEETTLEILACSTVKRLLNYFHSSSELTGFFPRIDQIFPSSISKRYSKG